MKSPPPFHRIEVGERGYKSRDSSTQLVAQSAVSSVCRQGGFGFLKNDFDVLKSWVNRVGKEIHVWLCAIIAIFVFLPSRAKTCGVFIY